MITFQRLSIYSFLIAVIVFLSCNYNGDNTSPTESFYKGAIHEHNGYCLHPIQNSVGRESLWWDESKPISYRFVETPNVSKDSTQTVYEVLKFLSELQDSTDLRFVQARENEFSDMRFGMNALRGGQSYLGKDCAKIPQDSVSTNFGFIEYDKDGNERIVRHEILHALGFFHTQYHPKVRFNRLKYAEWRVGQGWTQAQVDAFFAYKDWLAINGVFSEEVDWHSIMFYHYPVWVFEDVELATRMQTNKLNYAMSVGDWMMVKAQYKRKTTAPIPPITDERCYTQFQIARIRKLLRDIDNIVK